RTVMEGCNHGPATLFFGECDVGLGQGRSVDGAIHEHPETIGRAVGHAAKLNHVARHETFEHLDREIVAAVEERDADLTIGELLGSLHGRVAAHHNRRVGNNGTATDLAALHLGAFDARIIAPFASVIEVGLALFELAAMTRKPRRILVAGDVHLRALVDALFAVDPFDPEALLFEQSFIIGYKFSESLEGGCRFKSDDFLHRSHSHNLKTPATAHRRKGWRAQSITHRIRNNVSEPLGRAFAGRILPGQGAPAHSVGTPWPYSASAATVLSTVPAVPVCCGSSMAAG